VEKNLLKIIIAIVFFAMLAFLAGILKNYAILNSMDENIKNVVGIASYTSLLVSLMISCIVLGLTILPRYFRPVFKFS
jgi:flagellar biosynthesis protein FlhB